MRHQVQGRKLGRTSSHRRAMFANMASSLILENRIETTLPKAKELRSVAERLVTMGKQGTLHARRRAVALIRNKAAVHKLFDELAKRFTDRHGGYTRVMKLGWRHGDAAPMAAIEYLGHDHGGHEHAGEGSEKRVHVKKPKAAAKKASAKEKVEKKKAAPQMKAHTDKKAPARKSTTRRTAKGE